MSNRSNCLLEYWVRFDITGNANTSIRWEFAGYLNLVTTTGTAMSVDVPVDSLTVRCNETFGSQVKVLSENFESGRSACKLRYYCQESLLGSSGN